MSPFGFVEMLSCLVMAFIDDVSGWYALSGVNLLELHASIRIQCLLFFNTALATRISTHASHAIQVKVDICLTLVEVCCWVLADKKRAAQ